MVDASLPRIGPLGPPGLLFEAEGVRVLASAAQTRLLLRADPDGLARAGVALGLPLPLAPLSSRQAGGLTALWLGPDECLLIGNPGVIDRAPAGSMQFDWPHTLVDISSRDVALEVEGPGAALLLASGVMLDLSPAAFPAGMCARTLLGKAPVLIWRRELEAFQLQTPRSYGPYVRDFLREAFIVPPAARA